MQILVYNNFTPALPAGYRWGVAYKRSWTFLTLQRKRWYGWRTIQQTSLKPAGMGIGHAIASAGEDLKEAAGL
jgi:hypothetical protein